MTDKLLPLSFDKAPTDKATLYDVSGSVYRGSTYICTVSKEEHGKLIVDSVNQVQQYREALRRIERQSRILSESNSPFTINEIAKKALTIKEES